MATNRGHVDGYLDQVDAGEADRIGGLPDHLLHGILIHLSDTIQVARTSVLSRRWRHVWSGLPELFFLNNTRPVPVAKAHDCVDAALAACSAPTIRLLDISMPYRKPLVPTNYVSRWLCFASQRVAGELRLSLPFDHTRKEEEVLLPLCERLTAITIYLFRILRFQLPPVGTFTVLATLRIQNTDIDGSELESVLSTRCPRLKELYLHSVTVIKHKDNVLSIRSHSIQRLETDINFDGQLHVDTPELQAFYPCVPGNFYISNSPKLSEVIWYSGLYDPTHHHFSALTGRHLRRLKTSTVFSPLPLMRRFDNVDELLLIVSIGKVLHCIYLLVPSYMPLE
ncbi:hypothetical protein PR202_gb15621 [Eleusine coracana subsp. coracana]|uniref:F-box domain-containing protein n=1 Tax=Eleusine coracana subsp. coracana TaxID=191504 RepID=A0AAV5EYD5_ELECO|nr:hypothetical protein PR202_gb15621 [Eleusine coracana subsp. coracana]